MNQRLQMELMRESRATEQEYEYIRSNTQAFIFQAGVFAINSCTDVIISEGRLLTNR